MKSYRNKSTLSKGKIEAEKSLDDFVGSRKRKGKAIILVGSFYGLRRHVRRMHRLGFENEDIVIVERDLKTFASLRKMANNVYCGVQVIHGDLIEVLRASLATGLDVEYIEADGVMRFHYGFDGELLEFFRRYECIKAMSINGTTRGIHPDLELMARQRNIRRSRTIHNNLTYRPNKIIPKVLQEYADKNITTQYQTYCGVGSTPMYLIKLRRTA